jgi:hypothetical protein
MMNDLYLTYSPILRSTMGLWVISPNLEVFVEGFYGLK